jgi:Ca-activated chloride channel homolog
MISDMRKIVFIIIALWFSIPAFAQKERKFVRKGNDYFEEGLKDTAKLDTISFGKAEIAYRKALQIKPEDFHWNFNLADAIYKQKKAEEAATEFEKLADHAEKPLEKSAVYHNLGNSLLQQKKFDPSIEAYKKALRINPGDPETKYNLAYALKMKKKDEEQKQKQKQDKKDQNKDQNKDKNKDQNKDKNQNKDQNKDNKNNQNKDQNPQNQQNKPQQNKISRQNAEQMLQALENDEKQTQEKVKKAQAVQAQRSNIEKNW